MNKTQESTQVQETSDKQSEISSPKRVSPVVSKENQDSNSIKLTLSGAVQLTSPKSNKEATYHDKRKWDDSFTIAEKSDFTGNIVKASRDIDGETCVTLQEEEFTKLSEKPDEESHESDDSESERKPGRKPMADDEENSDSDQDPKVKRKAQNRAAQRAFRERKERYVKELEAKIKQVQDTHLMATSQLIRENHQLRSIIYRLEAENYALKGIQMPYSPMHTQPQTTQPPPVPVQQQQQQSSSGGSTGNSTRGNYPAIAPLLPTPGPLQTPFVLPAYSHSVSAHINSSSDSSMMIIPSSPVPVNTSSPSPTLTASTTSSKKSTIKPKAVTPPPPQPASNNQPLEYTFAISTPASLKPSGGTVSNQYKGARVEPIELVQLYPPGSRQPQNNRNYRSASESPSTPSITDPLLLSPKSNQSHTSSVNRAHSVVSSTGSIGDGESSEKSGRSPNMQQQKKITQLENDLFDCHIDVEGQLFCERLHNEVCNDAFDRLLSEPLFDQMGKLNLSIGNYPVPIVTGPMTKLSLKDDPKSSKESEKHEQEPKRQVSFLASSENKDQHQERDLLTVSEIWFALTQHSKFKEFSTDQLCQAVKELAKCADGGPVLEEDDLYDIIKRMDKGKL